jgi:hypothetical protein
VGERSACETCTKPHNSAQKAAQLATFPQLGAEHPLYCPWLRRTAGLVCRVQKNILKVPPALLNRGTAEGMVFTTTACGTPYRRVQAQKQQVPSILNFTTAAIARRDPDCRAIRARQTAQKAALKNELGCNPGRLYQRSFEE